MRCTPTGILLRTLGPVLVLLIVLPLRGAAQLPPDVDWQRFDTPRFRVHFDPAVEGVARRAADLAERAWDLLAATLPEPGGGRVDLIVTDHVDASNGFAGVTPWRRITVWAAPPMEGGALTFFDDWLELLVTHELAHIFHLDHGAGLAHAARAASGRPPSLWPVFPNRALPGWVIEGLAVHYESSLTTAGRSRGTWHEMVLRTAALEGSFESIDQVGGETPVWPGGQRRYIYGSLFFSHLAERHGEAAVGRFVRAVGGQWIPFRIDAAAREAFGESFSEAWEAWHEEWRLRAAAEADAWAALRPLSEPEVLTRGARGALHPRFLKDGTLVYTRADGRSDPQLRKRSAGGDDRFLFRTNGSATFTALPGGDLLVAHFEPDGPWRVRRDLARVTAEGGGERLTRGARLGFPDADPSGSSVVAVEEGRGTNRLVRVHPGTGGVTPLTPFSDRVHWGWPRVSPDGRWIAVIRWSAGERHELLLLDPEGTVRWRVAGEGAVETTPAWSPDGRHLLWSSDRTGTPNLFGAGIHPVTGEPGPVRQVTHLVTGALHPAVDPSGEWLVFSLYGPSGWDLARLPFEPAAWLPPLPTDPRFALRGGVAGALPPVEAGVVRSGVPLSTALLPRWWLPEWGAGARVEGVAVLGPRITLAAEGGDPLERHAWRAELGGRPSPGEGEGVRLEGGVGHSYAGLGNPLLGWSVEQQWRSAGRLRVPGAEGAPETLLYPVERERSAGVSATLQHPRGRSRWAVSTAGRVVRQDRSLQEADGAPSARFRLSDPNRTLGELRLSGVRSTVRSHAFSPGAGAGLSVSVSGRRRWQPGLADSLGGVPGRDPALTELVATARAFRPLGIGRPGETVLALRAAVGRGWGPGAQDRLFSTGGAAGETESITGLGLFGGRALAFPVRGHAEGARTGPGAWAASMEVRFPLLRLHRGLGPSLLHFDRMEGSLFLDAGGVWPGAGDSLRPGSSLAAAGGEWVLRFTPLWLDPVDLRVGAGLPLAGGGGGRLHLRLGRPF
jgi:hypothetical protein